VLDAVRRNGTRMPAMQLQLVAGPLADPSDGPFIGCTLAAGCPVVTGHVQDLPALSGLRVKSARDWVASQAFGGAQ
jgi:hypothetical protein